MSSLLPLYARIRGDAPYYDHLAGVANPQTNWAALPAQAESQGLAPLLYTHLHRAGVSLPPEVKQQLQGLYLRHRRAAQIRTALLAEILSAYQAAGIEVLVLKGAALAYLIYPEAGLRPMGDIDLLVKQAQIYEAQGLLAEMGFGVPLTRPDRLPDKHLLAITRQVDEFPITVELHYNLFEEDYPASMAIERLPGPPIAFSPGAVTAYTLGYEDMLWHLCHHVAYHTQVWKPIRLIWVADIVGFAEQFVDEIDWAAVTRQVPIIPNTLSLLHFITPLSEQLRRHAQINIGRTPQGVGQFFQGWPQSSIAKQREKGYRRILYDTFYPPEWWLRLRYRLGSTAPLFWYRWVRHPLHILGWVLDLVKKRLGLARR